MLSKRTILELIARLSNFLLNEEEKKRTSASNFYGVWEDGDSDDNLNEEIKVSRKFKNDIWQYE